MNPVFRQADKRDIDSLISLLTYLLTIDGDFPINEENMRRGYEMILDSDNAWVIVAELEGEVVGMCSISSLISSVQGGYVGFVEDVVMRKDMSGKGIALKMFEYLENFAKAKDMTRLQLMVSSDNQPAKAFYKKQGWSETEFIACLKML